MSRSGEGLASATVFCLNGAQSTSTAMSQPIRFFFGFWYFSHRTGGGRG
ncbi:hypothetical protein GALL_498060 [mine drainage metagenome]|uniref:Uncharacterized protein n=1 Tax=mine drainage metagenome TaxID=410659 RepID=A0A1J5PCX0_9ZZZZ